MFFVFKGKIIVATAANMNYLGTNPINSGIRILKSVKTVYNQIIKFINRRKNVFITVLVNIAIFIVYSFFILIKFTFTAFSS